MQTEAQAAPRGGPDFPGLYQRFKNMPRGQQAELRRVAAPDDLALVPALYRMFPGERVREAWLRVAFLLPWCSHREGAASFGAQLAKARVSEARVFQVARAHAPLDLIQLRRLAMQIEPEVDWHRFGWMLLKWDQNAKRDLVEDFFIAQTEQPKRKA